MKHIRKAAIIAAIVLCIIFLSSCEATKITYPHLEYRASNFNFDIKNKTILLRDKFYLNDGRPYDMVDTENGYDLILHFTENGR